MKKISIGLILLIYIVVILIGGSTYAADDPVKATADSIHGDTQKKWAFLEGNVRIVQKNTVITTEKAEIDLDKKLLFLKSRLKLTSSEITVEADSLDYNLKQKQGTFKGNVTMNRVEVKDDGGKVTKDPFKLMCEELYFETETKNFTATQHARVEHKDFNGSGDAIEYHDARQELWFKKNTYLKKPSGEEIRGDSVKIDLKAKNFTVTQNVTINLNVDDDEKKE